MNSSVVIIVLVQLMIFCTPLAGHSAALDRDRDQDQLWNIDRELFQDCLRQRESLRVKHHRMVLPRTRVWIHARLQQGDLLQELLTPEVMGHGSIQQAEDAGRSQKNRDENNRQENLILKEFTAEASIQ